MISLLSYKGTLQSFIPATLMHSLWSHPNLLSEREITKRYPVNPKFKWRCTPQSAVVESDGLAWPVFVLCVDVESRWDKMDGEVKWATQRAERCMAEHMEWNGMTDEWITESHWSLACHCWVGSRNSQAGQSQLTSSLLQARLGTSQEKNCWNCLPLEGSFCL